MIREWTRQREIEDRLGEQWRGAKGTYLPQSRIAQNPLIRPHTLRYRPLDHPRWQGPHDSPFQSLPAGITHELRAGNRALALGMAINRPRHILPQSLDVLFDGGRCIVETRVGAQGLQAGMVLGGGYGDDVDGGVEEVCLLDGVHACVCGGAVDQELRRFKASDRQRCMHS